jgi:hypothetical protein
MGHIEWTKSSMVEWVGVIFLTGKFLPNFDLKSMISTYTGFSIKTIGQICQILIDFFF